MNDHVRARILVTDRGTTLVDELRTALGGDQRPEIVHLRKTTSLREVHGEQGPWDVIVAGPSEESAAGLRRLVDLRSADQEIGLVLTVNGTLPADLTALVRTHPDDLVTLPASPPSLRGAITTALHGAARRRGLDADAAASATRAPEPPTLATTITVGGPTGGSGKTMIATNLAYLMAHRPDSSVVLVDLDLQFGEITAALQLRPVATAYDLLYDEQGRALSDAALAESIMEALTPVDGGFSVLAAPQDPVQADAIGSDEVARVLAALRARVDVVICDTPTGLRETTLTTLDHTDHLVCVTQVDIPGLYNLRTYLDTLDRLGVDAHARTVVLNKDLPNTGVTASDAHTVLGTTGTAIPFEPGVTRALNEGKPVCQALPGSAVDRAIRGALATLIPEEAREAPRSRRGLLGLFSRSRR